MAEQWAERIGKIKRTNSVSLYLVKKVLCRPNDYKAIAKAVIGKNTDKFKVLRLIGSNPMIMNYKQKNDGLEYYLVAGKNRLEAMRQTTAQHPVLEINAQPYFNPTAAREYDTIMADIIYNHKPESLEMFLENIKAMKFF